MFYDMAILVEEQGEMIDLIEHNVELAAAHVEVGQQNIRRAAEYSRSNRRVSRKLITIRIAFGRRGCVRSLLGLIYPPFLNSNNYGVDPLGFVCAPPP
jgi:hypothetical protein